MIDSNINYNGLVEIYARTRGGKKLLLERHNNGTPRLFSFLCFTLTGRGGIDYLPSQIILAKGTPGTDLTPVMSSPSTITSSYRDDLINPSAVFTGIIASYQISDPTIASDNLYLCLLDSNKTESSIDTRLLAYVQVSDSLNNIPTGTVLSVEWNLGFSNPS